VSATQQSGAADRDSGKLRERYVSAAASLAVGAAFFALWFWLLPGWLGLRVQAPGAARWRWIGVLPSVLGFAVALRSIWDFRLDWPRDSCAYNPALAPGRYRLLSLCPQPHVRGVRRRLDRALGCLRTRKSGAHRFSRSCRPGRAFVCSVLRRTHSAQEIWRWLRRLPAQRTALVAPFQPLAPALITLTSASFTIVTSGAPEWRSVFRIWLSALGISRASKANTTAWVLAALHVCEKGGTTRLQVRVPESARCDAPAKATARRTRAPGTSKYAVSSAHPCASYHVAAGPRTRRSERGETSEQCRACSHNHRHTAAERRLAVPRTITETFVGYPCVITLLLA
jgi:hypothetical protein